MSLTILFFCFTVSKAFAINNDTITIGEEVSDNEIRIEDKTSDVFSGVYTECFLYFSYSCLQKKTLLYLKELNKLSEVSVIGEYVKFVKVNETEAEDADAQTKNPEELSFEIDRAVDRFFNSHILKFSALGKEVSTDHTMEEFVGRKRKGGGGGGGGHHGGGDDGGKKKMMMMAMMCMKMKFMMMVPAMMGMMGMMSFKGMMFSMMSFMISKMMLLMKILEKKGGGGGGSGGGDGINSAYEEKASKYYSEFKDEPRKESSKIGRGGWAAGGGGGGGAWMPAGGQDYGGGGGGGGGYDANGQWQSRSIAEDIHETLGDQNRPIVSYVTPLVRFNNRMNSKKPYSTIKTLNDEVVKLNQKKNEPKSRKKRGIVDLLQNAYVYWINQVLGAHRNKKLQPKFPKFRIVNGMKYVYYPVKYVPQVQKQKSPRELTNQEVKKETPIITAEDLIKGEIIEGPVESRMNKKKFDAMKNDLNEVLEDNPWE